MKKLTTTIIATALVGAISFTAFASAASANEKRNGPGARNVGPIHFVCSDEAAGRIETRLSRMAERLELSDTQTASFDSFKTATLSAQAEFSEACADFKPAERGQANSDTDLVDRLNNRQAIMSAQLSAMEDVLPEFEAFFDSLTDEQKEQMRPQRGKGNHSHGPRGNNGQHSHGPNGNGPNGQGPNGGQPASNS